MMSQGTLGWNYLGKSQRHVKRSKDYARSFKTKKEFPLSKSEVTMGRSLRMLNLKHFAMSMISRRNSHPQRLCNKVGLLKGRTG